MNRNLLRDYIAQARRERELPDPATRGSIRRRANLTQRQLAEALGVTRVTVARWEIGTRTPRGDLLDDYLEALQELVERGNGHG